MCVCVWILQCALLLCSFSTIMKRCNALKWLGRFRVIRIDINRFEQHWLHSLSHYGWKRHCTGNVACLDRILAIILLRHGGGGGGVAALGNLLESTYQTHVLDAMRSWRCAFLGFSISHIYRAKFNYECPMAALHKWFLDTLDFSMRENEVDYWEWNAIYDLWWLWMGVLFQWLLNPMWLVNTIHFVQSDFDFIAAQNLIVIEKIPHCLQAKWIYEKRNNESS